MDEGLDTDSIDEIRVPHDLATPAEWLDDLIEDLFGEIPERYMADTNLSFRAILTSMNEGENGSAAEVGFIHVSFRKWSQ